MDYQSKYLSETGYDAVFVSPWAAPEGIFREIARRYPELTMRYAALEEGNEYSFLLTVQNGEIREERPAITDAFIDEVEGQGEIEGRLDLERSYYEKPATLRPRPVRHFRHWRNEARLKRALSSYPIYRPPHQGVAMMMSEQKALENYEFFLAHKDARIDALRRFLRSFGVPLDFTEQTKGALDTWFATYAAFLYVPESGSSFWTHNPEWSGERLSHNLIFDLAVFLGEFAIKESPVLRWGMDSEIEPGRTRTDEYYQRLAVVAVAAPLLSFPRDVMREVYNFCRSQCEASYLWKRSLYTYGSRPLARQFVTKTLRYINLSAHGDFQTANAERARDQLVP